MTQSGARAPRGLIMLIRTPFSCAPVAASLRVVMDATEALIPFIQTLLTAAFVNAAVRVFQGQSERGDLLPALLGLVALVGVRYAMSLRDLADTRVGMRMDERFRADMAAKRARLEYQHVEDEKTWDLIERVCKQAATRMQEGFSNLMMLLRGVLMVVLMMTLIMSNVWWVGALLITLMVPFTWVALRAGKKQYAANQMAEGHMRRAKYLSTVLSDREGAEERYLFGSTDALNKRWFARYRTAWKIESKQEFKRYIQIKGTGVISMLVAGITGLALLMPVKTGAVSVGLFVALMTSLFDMAQNLSWSLPYAVSELSRSREYLRDLDAFLALSEMPGALDEPMLPDGFSLERIEFSHVRFRYPGTSRDVLTDFSCVMEAGKHYAVVGVNGAGKTTLTKLLTGLYDRYEGEICVNGRELRTYPQSVLKALFGVACQDFARYEIPLMDSLLLGVTQDERAARRAVDAVGLTDVYSRLKDGLHTPLGKIKPDGEELSGGEWQRVALARVLCRPAQMRILDEPTAALDPMAESRVYELFGRVSEGMTTLFITHRLGAARLADEIIVLDEGRVLEQGSHEALLKKNGLYARMYESQRSWFE